MQDSKNDSPINMSTQLSPNVAQYLHPDYFQPLPTTLDAKKSPLALLAQTCSSIGKDATPSKSIIPPIEKGQSPTKSIISHTEKDKKEMDKYRDKMTAGENGNRKSPNRDSGNESGRDSAKKSGLKTVPPKEIPPLVPILGCNSSKSSPALSSSFEKRNETVTVTAAMSRSMASSTHSGHSSSSSRSAGSDERDKDSEREREREKNRNNDADAKSGSRSSPEYIYNKFPGYIHHGLNSFGSGVTHPGLSSYRHGFSFDPATVSSAYASSLAAAHSGGYNIAASAVAALAAQNAAFSKTGLTSGLSPYVSYARVRTPSGATTLVPVCRDPYCTNCQLTMQNSHVSSTCTASGCTQCAHEKSLQSLSTLGMAGASSLSMLPQFSLANSLPSLSSSGLPSYEVTPSLYAHSLFGATAAHSQNMHYVCNWVVGTDYCGKRYATSEEFLQHVRSHTAASDSTSALIASYMSLGCPPPLGFPGYPHEPLPAHSSLSPNSLRATYPTIPSPLNSVMNGSRYHPYKSALPGVQPGMTPRQALASLGTYYSPYSLYGQRIGAAAVP